MATKYLDITVLLGETVSFPFPVYANDEETELLPLAEKRLEAILLPYSLGENPPVVLLEGEGLEVDYETSVVTLTIYGDPTKYDVGLGYWYLRASQEGAVSFLQRGSLLVGSTGVPPLEGEDE